ncbi:MAG: 16S rRNA (cytosine(967)-C(5))-methyltransferase RsmB [Verrucomicrobia bacterium]|nr:16S rRNA (cytosine(967)-C(5))-methyltransferase RsmB [Verrucomicrobiota bacterium]
MSGEREAGSFQKPFSQSGAKPFGKPFTKPGGGFRKKSGDQPGGGPEAPGGLPQWKARRTEGDDFPHQPFREERADDASPPAEVESSPHAGKFYERYVKRPTARRTEQAEQSDRREEHGPSRIERSLQSSEHPQRITSSVRAPNYDDPRERPGGAYARGPRPSSQPRSDDRRPQQDRPGRDNFQRRDDAPHRSGPMERNEGRAPMSASSGFRRDFDSSGRRDAYPRPDVRRDDRPGRPFNNEHRSSGSSGFNPARSEDAFDSRRDAGRRSGGGYNTGEQRDGYQQRDYRGDDRRERPFNSEQRRPGSSGFNPARSEDTFDSRRDAGRRSGGGYNQGERQDGYQQRDYRREDRRNYRQPEDDRRPWQDRPRENYGDERRRAPDRPAPHLEHRIIRSEGARADQSSTPPPEFEKAAPLCAAREMAAGVLLRRLQGNAFVEDILDDAFATAKMRPDDRRLAQEMVYGCVRWQAALDWLIARKTEDRPQLPQVQVFLRLGLYQLFFLDRVPPHAACFETVEIAKRLGFDQQANFINAILRRLDAERAGVMQSLADLQTSHPHIGYSHPEWLVQKWTARWGADNTRLLLEWNNTPPPTNIRVNALKTDSTKLIERWRLKESVEYDFVPCPWTEDHTVFALKTHPAIATLGSFRDGWFYVQDPSTLLAVQALDPWAGESILDLCAAPGGKTAYIAQRMENDGELLACDSSPERLKLVTENCTRLGVTCVKTLALGDHPEATLQYQKFDKVLVDAPCSNTGVLRRRLDLRWRLQPDEPARLRETQLKLLRLAALHIKPGGTLIYSTCSLEPEENTEVVKEFLAAHPQFKLESERELLPFQDGVDGAYVAKMRG